MSRHYFCNSNQGSSQYFHPEGPIRSRPVPFRSPGVSLPLGHLLLGPALCKEDLTEWGASGSSNCKLLGLSRGVDEQGKGRGSMADLANSETEGNHVEGSEHKSS